MSAPISIPLSEFHPRPAEIISIKDLGSKGQAQEVATQEPEQSSGSPSVAPGCIVSASPENLLEMQIPRSHPDLLS
jgi:hypothetical protein